LGISEAKRIIDNALFMADSTTSAQLQHRALTQHSDIRVHEAKRLVMQRDGARARAEVEAVLRLRGAIDNTVVFRASVILADSLMIEAKWEEAEEMLSGLLGASSLRTTFTQSQQAKRYIIPAFNDAGNKCLFLYRLLEKCQKLLAKSE
jgi:hypothetical protein